MQKASARRAQLRLVIIVLVALVAIAAVIAGAISVADDDSSDPESQKPAPEASESPDLAEGTGKMTPEKARLYTLLKPRRVSDDFSVGFPRDAMGVVSAAVHQWEEHPILDDERARRHLELTTSKDSPEYIDKRVSEVRSFREGAGLAPSGGQPKGLTITTTVNAVRARAVNADRSVVQVWLNFDRHASVEGKPDKDPLTDQQEYVVLKWEAGDWKLTGEPQYMKSGTVPAPYGPDSPAAFEDGWWQVTHDGS